MLFIVSPEEITSCGGYKWTQREKWIRDICDILRGGAAEGVLLNLVHCCLRDDIMGWLNNGIHYIQLDIEACDLCVTVRALLNEPL
jgi:hypothetical protein